MSKYKVSATHTIDLEIEVEGSNEEEARINASIQPLGEWYALSQELFINSADVIA